MAEPKRDYRIWRDGAEWHWQVMSVRDDVIASGVADSSSAARKAVFGYRFEPANEDQWQDGRGMPVYFFHLHGSKLRDIEGQELPDDEAARKEAEAVARELSRNQHVVSDDRLVVTNADGSVVHEEPLFPR